MVRMTAARYTMRDGDSPGGYWAVISEDGADVATVMKPGLAEHVVEVLNRDGAAISEAVLRIAAMLYDLRMSRSSSGTSLLADAEDAVGVLLREFDIETTPE